MRAAWFTLTMWLGPVLMAFLVSFKIPLFNHRYLVAASASMYLFLASGVSHFVNKAGVRNKSAMGIAALLVSALVITASSISLFNYYFNPRFGKEQWREVAHYVESSAHPGDAVVLYVGYIRIPYDYYAKRLDLDELTLNDGFKNEHGSVWSDISNVIKSHKRVWLIQSHLSDSGTRIVCFVR